MTTVKFIGLLVFIYTQNVGYQVLMPQFQTHPPVPKHDSLIAYPVADRMAGPDPKTEWRVAGKFKIGTTDWEYVDVKKELITLSGATDGVPAKVEQPRLRCCCPPMADGIKDDYKDPSLPITKRGGAQITVTRGQTSLFKDKYDSINTAFSMTTVGRAGIVITGTQGEGNNVKTINFRPKATVVFGNTPLCVIQGNCQTTGMSHGDFLMYYQMGRNPKATQCQNMPSTCEACRSGQPCPTECSIENLTATMNIDCSNSQWP